MRRTLILFTLLATGCGVLEKMTSPPAPAASTPQTVEAAANIPPGEELVAYLARIKSLDEPSLNAEATRQRQAAQRNSNEISRVKAAMALTVSAQGDEADILVLVDPLVRKEGRMDPDVRAMASFLQGIAHERRKLKENAAAAGNRARDAQRARDTERQRADALQERAAQLQQKLDALTDLEKSLSERPNAPR
jgi:FtsZ-binding cell division protein ZapB